MYENLDILLSTFLTTIWPPSSNLCRKTLSLDKILKHFYRPNLVFLSTILEKSLTKFCSIFKKKKFFNLQSVYREGHNASLIVAPEASVHWLGFGSHFVYDVMARDFPTRSGLPSRRHVPHVCSSILKDSASDSGSVESRFFELLPPPPPPRPMVNQMASTEMFVLNCKHRSWDGGRGGGGGGRDLKKKFALPKCAQIYLQHLLYQGWWRQSHSLRKLWSLAL